jgi:hypothetical protein
MAQKLFEEYLFVGQRFEFGEGQKVVGYGKIIKIINTHLQQASR